MYQWIWVAALLAAVPGQPSSSPAAAPVVRADGDAFTVNGTRQFLVLVSYFDAMDAAALERDLDYLAARVDGVRIFANWWDYAGQGRCQLRFSPGTLMEVRDDGSVGLRPARLKRLQEVLQAAGERGLIVDLTFAADPVKGLSRLRANAEGLACPPAGFENEVNWTGYRGALTELSRALAGPAYSHVWFDLQNEAGHAFNRVSDETLAGLVEAVRRVDSDRLITVSRVNPEPKRHVEVVKSLELSFLTFHDFPRGKGWGGRTARQVTRLAGALEAAGLTVPIYVGEPDSGAYDGGKREFMDAVQGARKAGAAAWTFHTRAAYRLDDEPLTSRLDAVGREVLEALAPLTGRAGAGSDATPPMRVH